MKTSTRSKLLVLFIAVCCFWTSGAQAQNTLDRAGLTAASPAAAAYSLRQLSTTYGGPAIQVRRSSDNTTQNIGFDGSGNLDLTSLLAFVGGGDGFVSIWYDQSGLGRNATQGTLASQPRIVTSGVVETQNGRPTLTFSGGQTLQSTLTAAQATTAGNITTTSAVFRSNTINSSLFSNGDGGGNRYNIHAPWGDGITYLDLGNIGTGGRVQVAGAWNTGLSVGTFQRNGTQGNIWRNGVNLISANTFATTVTSAATMWIGSFNGTSFFTVGTLSELIPFPSALSVANRTALECNQAAYFNISFAAPVGIEFFAQGSAASSACNFIEENVVWRLADLTNNSASGNNLSKVQGGSAWNGGAASWNTVSNNGYLEFTASETTTLRMIGLSSTNLNADWTSIRYAFYLNAGGILEIREEGSGNRITGETYTTGDVLRIAVEAGVVRYYKNGSVLFVSALIPTLPLIADCSINTVGGTLTGVKVGNLSTGNFSATLSGATALTYQWRLNGSPVGTNSATYSNASLAAGDLVTCEVTYNGVCGTTTLISNNLINRIVTNPTSIDFFIRGTTAASACNTVDEQVKWTLPDLLNLSATGNSLSKIQGGFAWNGGAASGNTVANNGYMEFTASETNTLRMIGLSSVNLNADWTTIRYAFYLNAGGILEIREEGSGNRITGGTYTTGDVLRIAVEAGVVRYFKNGTLLYISALIPTLPLLVDVSIASVGGTLNNVIVSNFNTGTFTATATNAGPSPTYQWRLNGTNVGTNSPSYTNTSLSNNDVITCVLTPDLGGCTLITYTSNTITNKVVPAPTSIDFFIRGTTAASACNTVDEQVKWTLPDLLNLSATGNSLSKIQGGFTWNGGAASGNTVANNGYMEFTASETNTLRMIGLSSVNLNADWTTIRYAFYLNAGGILEIREEGSGNRIVGGTYATGDILRIAVEAGVVRYYKNGTLLYISALIPTLPLLVDVSINSVGGTLNNVIVSNFNTGTFTATATNAGPSPTYQWRLNGTNVGTNSPSYTNTSLSNNDVITCVLTPDLGGCTLITYTSNTITNKVVPAPTSIDFFIRGTTAASACNTVDEQVKWTLPDLLNLSATGNSLSKIQGGFTWNGGAASGNTVANNGYMEFTASETNTLRMIGLSSVNLNADWTTIRYAFYLNAGGILEIREEGSGNRITGGTYTTGDVLRIAVEAGVVRYFKNGTLLYISALIPTLPLLVDVSINSVGGTLNNVIVSNFNTGTFTATATNAGPSPTYQWRLNGLNVGTNSATYTNTALNDNDVVTCVLTPDLGGCLLITYNSNAVTNKAVPAPTSIDFYLSGTISTSACAEAIEQVVWRLSDLVNTNASGNNLTKVQGGAAWNGGAASWNQVGDNGYLQFTASETNTLRVIGLSSVNLNADWTSIRYAFYLNTGGNLEIREQGSGNLLGAATYATGDILRIAVEAGTVKYFRNGALLYTSALVPTPPLLADASIFTVGGTITNALVVNNSNAGNFAVTATNAGPSPTFTWRVDGSVVQTGTSATYTNTALLPGQVVTCSLTPDLGGCFSAVYNSNSITINGPGAVPTTWTGAVSSNWNIAGNWTNGIPDKFKAAVIPSVGVTNLLNLTTSANVYDITIQAGASFTISGTNQLYVFRNFVNNGTFIPNSSRIHFVGCSNASSLSSSANQTFTNFTVNTSFGLTISGTGLQQISGNLSLVQGVITTTNPLVLLASSTTTGGTNASYVDGPIRKVGNTAYTFPTGDGGFYRPVTIGAPGIASDHFTAQYFRAAQTFGAALAPTLDRISSCEYWTLDRTNGASNVSVTLTWQEAACSTGYITNPATMVVTRWNGAQWVNQGNGGTTGTATNGSVVSLGPVTAFSPFTLGSLTAENPLPITLLSFQAVREESHVKLAWEVAEELNNDFFTIERSANGIDFETLFTEPGAGVRGGYKKYEIEDPTPLQGLSYYRLSQTDFDGTRTYFDVVRVNFSDLIEPEPIVFPNPILRSEPVSIQFLAPEEDQLRVTFVNTLGQIVNSSMHKLGRGFNYLSVPVDWTEGGIYFIKLESSRGQWLTKLVVR